MKQNTFENRIAYIPGPGDLRGTYQYWETGRHDPRVAVVTYSSMFFDMCKTLNADAMIIERGPKRAESFLSEKFRFDRIPFNPSGNTLSYYREKIRFSAECISLIKSFRPRTVIIGGDFYWPYLPRVNAISNNVILSVHNSFWAMGTDPTSIKHKAHIYGKRLSIKAGISGAICVSEECKRQFNHISGGAIPILVFKPRFLPSTETHNGPTNEVPRLTYVGRIEENKGVVDLLSAYEDIRQKGIMATLSYAGDGAAFSILKDAVKRSVFSDDITLHGRLDGNGVRTLLRQSDLLVCPTRTEFYEGFAVTCTEAVFEGVPCLMSTAVPARDFIGDAGRVFQANDVQALSTNLETILCEPGLLAELKRNTIKLRKPLLDQAGSWGSQLTELLRH